MSFDVAREKCELNEKILDLLVAEMDVPFQAVSNQGQCIERFYQPTRSVGITGWHNWFQNANGILHPTFDTFPDVSEHSAAEQYPAPQLPLLDGQPAHLFSSRHPKTVLRYRVLPLANEDYANTTL